MGFFEEYSAPQGMAESRASVFGAQGEGDADAQQLEVLRKERNDAIADLAKIPDKIAKEINPSPGVLESNLANSQTKGDIQQALAPAQQAIADAAAEEAKEIQRAVGALAGAVSMADAGEVLVPQALFFGKKALNEGQGIRRREDNA